MFDLFCKTLHLITCLGKTSQISRMTWVTIYIQITAFLGLMVRTEDPDRVLIDSVILGSRNECFGVALNRFYVLCL